VVESSINKSKDIRERIFGFVLDNQIAIPPDTYKYENADDSIIGENEQESDKSITAEMLAFLRLEISEIKKDLDDSKLDDAKRKYQRMWLFTKKMLQIKNSSLIDSMVIMAFTDELSEFFLKNQKELSAVDFSDIANSVIDVPNLIDESFFYGFTREYYISKAFCEDCKYRWPAFDKYDTEKKLHAFFKYNIDLIRRKQLNTEVEGYRKLLSKPLWFAKNPYGNYYTFMCSGLDGGLPLNTVQKKTKVNILLYAMNMEKYRDNLPVDFYKGKPVEIVDKGTYVQVAKPGSPYENEGVESYYTIYK
jgi:hypothetical protein